MNAKSLLPYEEICMPNWSDDSGQFDVHKDRHDIVLRGNCPRCDYLLELLIPATVVKGPLFRRGQPQQAPGQSEPLICNCEEPHPDRPPDSVGCGAYWDWIVRSIPG